MKGETPPRPPPPHDSQHCCAPSLIPRVSASGVLMSVVVPVAVFVCVFVRVFMCVCVSRESERARVEQGKSALVHRF